VRPINLLGIRVSGSILKLLHTYSSIHKPAPTPLRIAVQVFYGRVIKCLHIQARWRKASLEAPPMLSRLRDGP